MLRQEVKLATPGTPETRSIANALRMRLSTIDGYGLAANQLGYDSQIFAYREKPKGPFEVVLNPTIEEYDDEQFNFREGCLSIPNFWWDLDRPRRVHLRGLTLGGDPVEIEAEDKLARIFQHEIDHFNGTLVIDRIPNDELADFKLKWYRMYKYLEPVDAEV